MVSDAVNLESGGPKPFSGGLSTPQTSSQQDNTPSSPPGFGSPGNSLPGALRLDGQNQAARAMGFTDELQALKRKILELEQQAESVQASQGQDKQNLPLVDKMEEYRRMEACLYKHRKEWNAKSPIERFSMGMDVRNVPLEYGFPHGPWLFNWDITSYDYHPPYHRPDPFDPAHQCGSDHEDARQDVPDEYDRTIDFGNRRDRLRKTFEWEMDRLYLAEETGIRRRTKVKEDKEQRLREASTAKWGTHRGNGRDAAGDIGRSVPPPPPSLSQFPQPGIKYIDWITFKHLAGVDLTRSSVINVLDGEPIFDNDIVGFRTWYGHSSRLGETENPQTRKTTAMVLGQNPLPERIRINSGAILMILSKILGSTDLKLEATGRESVLLIRPFKALIYCEQRLRDWCAGLEKKFNKATLKSNEDTTATARGSSPPDEIMEEDDSRSTEPAGTESKHISTSSLDSDASPLANNSVVTKEEIKEHHIDTSANDDKPEASEKKEDTGKEDDDAGSVTSVSSQDSGSSTSSSRVSHITKSEKALEHLKCLIEFMDTNISGKIAYVRSDDCRTVFFSDLWHFFRPGMEVVRPDGKQAYRVVHVTSAPHRVVPAWQSWYSGPNQGKKRVKAAFSITCVYVDFDGKQLGPVTRTFDIKRFEGQRDVTSLEVYPLRYHRLSRADTSEAEWKELQQYPVEQRFRQKLIRRGVKHMYYDGPTLEVREEVESQVVVDFETAFSFEDTPKEHLKKPDLEVLVGNIPSAGDGEDEGVDEPCRGACCRGELFVHNDSYVDDNQRTEYVNGLLPNTPSQDVPSVAIIPRPLKEIQTGPGNRPVMADDELVIMSYRVFGFVLRSRKWGEFSFFDSPSVGR